MIKFSSTVKFWVTPSLGKTIGAPVDVDVGASVDEVELSKIASVLLLSIGFSVLAEDDAFIAGASVVEVLAVVGVDDVVAFVVSAWVTSSGFMEDETGTSKIEKQITINKPFDLANKHLKLLVVNGFCVDVVLLSLICVEFCSTVVIVDCSIGTTLGNKTQSVGVAGVSVLETEISQNCLNILSFH